ncbi:MAG: FixH family protein [Dysgonamonadaceae bacterium]|jgi:hypothetical protein|nr:FixH family protein [Dysgonamonadaceae bacterium]
MKRIYNIIILLFALLSATYGQLLKEVTTTTGLATKNGEYTFKVKALYTASDVESPESGTPNPSAAGHELVTCKGWFKDRHCTWSLTPESVLTGSCSVACGTGGPAGQAMLAGCQAHGHGIWLNPTAGGHSHEEGEDHDHDHGDSDEDGDETFYTTSSSENGLELVVPYSALWNGTIVVKAGETFSFYVDVPAGASLAGCGSTVKIPGYEEWTDSFNQNQGHIQLAEGKHTVYSLTPAEEGDILFTCWMGSGCHKNVIHVTADGTYEEPEEPVETESVLTQTLPFSFNQNQPDVLVINGTPYGNLSASEAYRTTTQYWGDRAGETYNSYHRGFSVKTVLEAAGIDFDNLERAEVYDGTNPTDRKVFTKDQLNSLENDDLYATILYYGSTDIEGDFSYTSGINTYGLPSSNLIDVYSYPDETGGNHNTESVLSLSFAYDADVKSGLTAATDISTLADLLLIKVGDSETYTTYSDLLSEASITISDDMFGQSREGQYTDRAYLGFKLNSILAALNIDSSHVTNVKWYASASAGGVQIAQEKLADAIIPYATQRDNDNSFSMLRKPYILYPTKVYNALEKIKIYYTPADGRFLGFDAESSELLRAFLFQLNENAATFNGKLYLEVTGYPVQLPASEDGKTAPLIGEEARQATNFIDGFHAVSVKGAVIDTIQVFAENDYGLPIDALTPANVTAEATHDGYTVKFTPPITAASLSPKFGVKGYKVNIYENGVIADTRTVDNDPAHPLSEIPVTGLTAGEDHVFHIYTESGKLNIGFNEIYFGLTDEDGCDIDEFTVGNIHPLMDMGMHKHSTPVGAVEKVAINGKTLYKTWISFLMYTGQGNGTWALDFDYTIGETRGKIIDAVPQVDNYSRPNEEKWLQTFSFDGATHVLSLAWPKSLTVGTQTVKAYINKVENTLLPYPVVKGGFRVEVTPVMRSMGHGSLSHNAPLTWNAENGDYEGSVNFSMDGDWRIGLKIYNAVADTLITGTDINNEGDNTTVYWDIYIDNSTGISAVPASGISVHPTVSSGDFNISVPAAGEARLFGIAGNLFASYTLSAGDNAIRVNVPGIYILTVVSSGKVFTYKIIVRK